MTGMFRRILVGVDGSGPSSAGLTAALRLAREQDAKVRVVHVADTVPPAGIEDTYIWLDGYREGALAAGRQVIRRAEARARAERVRTEAAVVETLVHDTSGAIVEEAARWRADLVALGTHGRSGLARVVLGSVAEDVARHATTAVLLVKRAPRRRRAGRSFGRILVAVDGSDPAKRALGTALRFAKERRAAVRAVHVADTFPAASLGEAYIDVDAYRDAALAAGRAVIGAARRQARAAGTRLDAAMLETVSHDASGAIAADARRWRADLVVLGTHGRTGLARLFLGSVAEGVARHAAAPVLLVRGAPRRRRRASAR